MKLLGIMTLLLSLFSTSVFARDYLIFNISQDLPMGTKNEVITKNYYVNMGAKQGLKKGSTLAVYRRLSRLNPYDNEKRVSFNIKVGEIEVLHAQENSAIGKMKALHNGDKDPIRDLAYFMVGDTVAVAVD